MSVAIIFLIILACLVYTLIKYSQEGDISTMTAGCPKVKDIKSKYQTKDAVVERLHNLIVYKEGYVRWNRFLIIALFVSMIIVYYFRKKVDLAEVLVLSCFIFLAIDLPSRWGHSHISSGIVQEATILHAHNSSIF